MDLVYWCVSTMHEPDVTLYPDSDKVGVMGGEPPGGDSDQRTVEACFNTNYEWGYWDKEISR